jgi:carboxymethylenebutenolidase
MSRRLSVLALLAVSACTLQRSAPVTQTAAVDDHMAHMRPEDLRAPMSMGDMANMPEMVAGSQDDATLPASNVKAAARLAASPRHGEWVRFPAAPGSKDSIGAWIVYPVTKTKAPVVVVVHEIFGLTTWVRAVADQAAAEGFIAIAPDFLSRARGGPSEIELRNDSVSKIIRSVTNAERVSVASAAANYAMMQPSAQQKYAVIGYCWGGQTVWMNAVAGGVKGFSGGVAYYGLPYLGGGSPATATTAAVPQSFIVDSLKKIKKPVLMLNGASDTRIGAAMPALDSLMLKALKKDYASQNYPGAIHGFLRAQDDARARRQADTVRKIAAETDSIVNLERAANLAATKDGWPRTVAFLRKSLGVK